MDYKDEAKMFCDAIKTIATRPDNLKNLESYLEQHFDCWLKKYASTPEDITSEMIQFANLEIRLP